jgi:putative ABC transport system permease protein
MTEPVVLRLCRHAIDALSRLALSWRADDVRREWLGELHARTSGPSGSGLSRVAQLRLLARCSGAIFFIIWSWKHEWSLDMSTVDVRYGFRMLARRPVFALIAIATLALGIGATTAIFSAVHGVLMRPLPYPQPDRLVKISGVDARRGNLALGNLSVPDVVDFTRLTTSFDALGAHNLGSFVTVTGGAEAERAPYLLVTSGYFRALGARTSLGRLFVADEDRPTPPDVVVISDGFWKRRFGGDPEIVGKSVVLGGQPSVVIGVLAPEFVHPDPALDAQPDVFALLDPDPEVSGRGGRYVRAVARLDEQVSLRTAEAELKGIAASLEREYAETNTGRSIAMRPLANEVTGDVRTPFVVLQAATCAILLIVCLNLANVLLAAGSTRSGELTVRRALGATRARVMRQLLTESLILAAIGGGLGVALAWWGTDALSKLTAISPFHRGRITLDGTVLLFAFAASLVAGLLFGVLPAVQVARRSDSTAGGSFLRHTDGRAAGRLRASLVAIEVAVSVALLIGAGLLIRSFWHLTHVDPGFHANRLLSFRVAVPSASYDDPQRQVFYDRLYSRIRTLTGVQSVGGVNILPLSGGYSCDGFHVQGQVIVKGQEPCAEVRSASPSYFETMGIALVEGRLFTERDDAAAPRVVVVNQALARQFFPNENPSGAGSCTHRAGRTMPARSSASSVTFATSASIASRCPSSTRHRPSRQATAACTW